MRDNVKQNKDRRLHVRKIWYLGILDTLVNDRFLFVGFFVSFLGA